MKQIILIIAAVAIFAGSIYAHTAFTLVRSEKKTVKSGELAAIEKQQTVGKKDKTNLSFVEKQITLVAVTGPEDDMLSYRIQGVRNPNLIVPSGSTIRLLFINIDGDMRHVCVLGGVTLPGRFDAALHPIDLGEVNTVFFRKDSADPASRTLAITQRADPLPLKVLRR